MNNIEFLKEYGIRITLIPYSECDEDNYLINLMIEKPDWTYLQITFNQMDLQNKLSKVETKIVGKELKEL